MRAAVVGLLLCAVTGTCGRSRFTPPSDADRALALRVGLTDSALIAIREIVSSPLGELRPLDSLGNLLPARGVSFALPQSQVERTIVRLRAGLGVNHLVFQADRSYGYGLDSVGIIPSRDPFDMLRVRSTSGVNYDISGDSVLALARRWDEQFGLEFTGAGPDWFEARLRRRPTDFLALARVLYAVCPDIVDQGTNTVEALADEMRRTNTLFCWWD